MNKIEEFERDLKVAYLNYENNDLKETLKYLDRMLEIILKEDKSLENDPFWKTLTCDIFKAIVLNNFYNKTELTGNNLDSLLGNEEELKKHIKEFCKNFRNNELINFISHIENTTDKPLKSVIQIIVGNTKKIKNPTIKNDEKKDNCKHNWVRIDDEILMVMMKRDDGSRREVELGNFKCTKCGILQKKNLLEMFNEDNSIFTNYAEMEYVQIKQLINDKINLLSNKLSGNIDANEHDNPGYLFWNCKMILINIYMACDKLINKFGEFLTESEINNYLYISDLLKNDESNWNNIVSIENIFKKFKDRI